MKEGFMPTSNEYRHCSESCLLLAQDTQEIYAKVALIELAEELRLRAEHLEPRTADGRTA